MTDPLEHLITLPDIADVVTRADLAVSSVSNQVRDGDHVHTMALRAWAVLDGDVTSGAIRIDSHLRDLVTVWSRAPMQVLARLHVLAAKGIVPSDQLGRPTKTGETNERLVGLASLVTGGTHVSPLLLAAIVHAELLTLAPFGKVSPMIARAASRMVLAAGNGRPVDILFPEIGHAQRLPEYRGASGAYATGRTDGIRSWIKHYCGAVVDSVGCINDGGASQDEAPPHDAGRLGYQAAPSS